MPVGPQSGLIDILGGGGGGGGGYEPYTGTDRDNTEYPVGAMLIAWSGNTVINKHYRMYVTTIGHVHGCETYGKRFKVWLNGTWAARGYVGVYTEESTFIYERIY